MISLWWSHYPIFSFLNLFLAATKQLYKWYFPSVRPSVCPSVRLLVISLPNQHMEFSHPKSFVMPGSAVRKLICSKGLRASPKNYYGNTTPSMAWSHHWRNVWRNIAGSRPNWAQDFTRTSQKNSRSSQKNYYQHSRNFGTSYFCLSYLLHKQAYVQLDEVTPVAGGLTLHSCYCN